jgi:hypothetical protein
MGTVWAASVTRLPKKRVLSIPSGSTRDSALCEGLPDEGGESNMVGEVLFGMLVVASTMSQAVEPAKLALACHGHTQYLEADSQSPPVSLGITVDLADRTVQGFRYPEDFPIKIIDVNETTIIFHGSSRHASGATYRQINGGIDRVTGDGEATSDVTSWRDSKASAIHSLKCKPAHRSFLSQGMRELLR